MGKLGCTINGSLDESKFSEPMPWIGIYVAAASAACGLAMALDAFHGFRYRKFWFPCKFFSLNATTLTLVTVAIKLSVDLNTSMPRQQDQLAKLSSDVFICTVISNFMPSLGSMENKELMMNIIALGILVITSIVNICIQLGTGVIYVFWIEHGVVMFLMVVLLVTILSSALTVPPTKSHFDVKYRKKKDLALKECKNKYAACIVQKLRDDLMKYWIMAHTCNPQFVMGRLATCTASGAFCLLSTMILAEAVLRCYLMPRSFRFCSGQSEYKWSTPLILATQAVAIIIGTIAPASRWFIAINFRCPKRDKKVHRPEFNVENYWIRKLVQWKECPLVLRIGGRRGRKLAQTTKNKLLDFCIWTQSRMVFLCKFVRFISIFIVSWLLVGCRCCKKLISLLKRNTAVLDQNMESDAKANWKMDLGPYVLHLEGEKELIDLVMEHNCDATGHWIRMGRKKQPKNLIKLLEKFNPSHGFQGVKNFDGDLVTSLESEEPPNCWALPVVTLTSIAVAVCKTDFHLVKELINSVHEGLIYIRIIETSLDGGRNLRNTRDAAEAVWVGVDLYYKWLDVDLRQMAMQEKSPNEVLEDLCKIAKQKFMDFKKEDFHGCLKDTPSMWPIKVLAANSMYRVCQTLLISSERMYHEQSGMLFRRLTSLITDIMAACLTNLQHAIIMQCHNSTIEAREECVRHALLLLGQMEKILEILGHQQLPSSDPDLLANIDYWRVSHKPNEPVHSESVISSYTTSSSSSDLHLTID